MDELLTDRITIHRKDGTKFENVPASVQKNKIRTMKDYKPFSDEAVAWAKDLKKRGFKFMGPTVVYAHMQATGMVNDHSVDCFHR